jgi:hypothetical protein
MGLSVYEKKQDVIHLRNAVPFFRNHAIGRSKLTAEMGKIKPTSSQYGNSHRTWWIPENIKPWQNFEIIGK